MSIGAEPGHPLPADDAVEDTTGRTTSGRELPDALPVPIEKLACVRFGMRDAAAAAHFLAETVGLQPVDGADRVHRLRSDWRDHTVALHGDVTEPPSLALEVRDTEALEVALAGARALGLDAAPLGEAACAARRVRAGLSIPVRGGPAIELVVRPLHSGWRYFPKRDAGIVEFHGAAFGSTDVDADVAMWTTLLGGRVTDYVGDAAYVAIDDEHHRIAIHPCETDRILEIQFRLEGLHELMQNHYFLQGAQVSIAHGPGRRPTSEQAFLTFRGPEDLVIGLVAEGRTIDRAAEHLPRQYPRHPDSFCAWGSVSEMPEYR